MKKILILFTLILGLISCEGPGQPQSTSENYGGYHVVKLFTVDSVTVYRFYDGGHHHYFTSRGSVMTVLSSDGKTFITEEVN